MSGESVVSALERFFLDIVGTLAPGLTLLVGISAVSATAVTEQKAPLLPPQGLFEWLLMLGTAYIVGHAITSVGERIVEPILEWLAIRRPFAWFLGFAMPKKNLERIITEGDPYQRFVKLYELRTGLNLRTLLPSTNQMHEWRSIAMSVAREDRETVYRFMFLSLLSLGVAVALLLILVLWTVLTTLHYFNLSPPPSHVSALQTWGAILLLLPLLERRYRFYGMSMRVPFSMALGQLARSADGKEVWKEEPKS